LEIVMRLATACLLAVTLASGLSQATPAAQDRGKELFAVGYRSERDLARAVAAAHATVVRRISALHVAEVRGSGSTFARIARPLGGIRYVQPALARVPRTEPALATAVVPYEWQYAATHEDAVPPAVLHAAGAVTIAVIDTGADLAAPDLAAKAPQTHNLIGSSDVRDVNGHGTFVASLAAGSVSNGDGIAGFGGDARLLVIKAVRDDGSLTDLDEANGIVYAVDHGARVINLSVGGPSTSFTERQAIDYAAAHGVLVVAAVGNEYTHGNPVEYPAALLQPVGSRGHGGLGLAVGASTTRGSRAFFSNVGSQLSLVAPGENVFSDVSALSSPAEYPRQALPGSAAGHYGFASGTSFAAPEVAGAAALVWGANPFLRPAEVAAILKSTASGRGAWNRELGYGVLDVAAAVARAQGPSGVVVRATRVGRHLQLRWFGAAASRYRITMRVDGKGRVLLDATTFTAVSVTVRHRHRYAFTVDALDASGAPAGTTTYALRA
jgi:subtilisin family serine protease